VGTEARIGVGAAVVAILAAVGVFLFFRRRRRYEAAPTELPSHREDKYGNYQAGTLVEAFAPTKQRSEVDGTSRPVEMQG
jgi:membrane protein implicated in regulation of membrane protease activity